MALRKREKMKTWQKKAVILGLGVFYTLAGINHFISPSFYIPLIPPVFPNPDFINVTAGIFEILLGLGVFFFPTRKFAAWGIVTMFLAFIPSHWYFLQIGSCIQDGLCVPAFIGWIRLLVIHPMLIYWAFWVSRQTGLS